MKILIYNFHKFIILIVLLNYNNNYIIIIYYIKISNEINKWIFRIH